MHTQPSRRHLTLLVTGLALALVLVQTACGLAGGQSASELQRTAPNSATLSPLRQLVEVRYAGQDEWKPVAQAITISSGDTIRTGVGGVGLIVFAEGTNTEVHPNSVLTIESLQSGRNRLALEMRLSTGQTLNRVSPLRGPDSRHILRTPTAVVEVRGTAYWSSVDDDGQGKFQPTEGTITLSPGQGDPLSLGAGDCREINADGSPGADCSGESAPDALTEGLPVLSIRGFLGTVDLSNCGDDFCDESVGENVYSCRPDCYQPECGNLICELEESAITCEIDCIGFGGAVCGDRVCEPEGGEDYIKCSADCEPPPLVCGDGLCSDRIGEDIYSCAVDCAPFGYCGDDVCNDDIGESRETCSVDCGLPGRCGDGICDPERRETPFTCLADCPASAFCGDGKCESFFDEETTCPADCDATPVPATCGDGVCDPDIGEDSDTCSADCGSPPATCGDGVCDPDIGEDSDTCSADCGGGPDPCGDGVCDPDVGEDNETCSVDCGGGPSPCGDGVCDPDIGENSGTCSADCGSPPSPCGDGTCDPGIGEDSDSCPADCEAPPEEEAEPDPCGDGTCDPGGGEDPDSCPADCPPEEEEASNAAYALACIQPPTEPVCRLPDTRPRFASLFALNLFPLRRA